MPLQSSRSLSQAGTEPPPADVAVTANSATPIDDQPPVEATAQAPAPSPPKVFSIQAANVTAVSTIDQLRRAVAQAALDIEIHAHLDLRPLLEDVRSEPVGNSPDLERDRESALDALAMLEVNVRTRSIRGNCSDPNAAAALELPAGGGGKAPLLPLKPFQCLLLVPDTFLAVPTGRLWVDNLYLRLQPASRVLTSLQRTPSFLALGRRAPNTRFSDYSWRNDWPDETELHLTDITFQGDGVRSIHAVKAAAIGKDTIAHFRECIFADWGGLAPPVVAARFSTASIAQTTFLNMRQQAEIVDVSLNGAVRFESVTFAGAGGPPKGRIVGTSMNDYSTSPAFDSYDLGVYYPGDDANYDVDVEEMQEEGGAFGANRVITKAVMSDCLFQAFDKEANAPQPGCPPESVQARAAVGARMRNETATPVLLTEPEVYYRDDNSKYAFKLLDYEFVQPAPPATDISLPPLSALAPGPSGSVAPDVNDGGAPLEDAGGGRFAPGGDIIGEEVPGSVASGPGGLDASAPLDGSDYVYDYEYYDSGAYQYGYDKPSVTERLQALEEPSPWFAAMQRVLPRFPPPPPGWPPLAVDAASPIWRTSLAPVTTITPADVQARLLQPIGSGPPIPEEDAGSPGQPLSALGILLTCVGAAVLLVCVGTGALMVRGGTARQRRRQAAASAADGTDGSDTAPHRSSSSMEVHGATHTVACATASAVAHGSVPNSAMDPAEEYSLPTEVARLMADRTLIHETANDSKPLPGQDHVKMKLESVNSEQSSSSHSDSLDSEKDTKVLEVAATRPSRTSNGSPLGGALSLHSSTMRLASPAPTCADTATHMHGQHLFSLPLDVVAAAVSPAAPALCGELQRDVDPPVPSSMPPEAPIQEVEGSLAKDVRLPRILPSDPSSGWLDWTVQAMDAENFAATPPRAAIATLSIPDADCRSASEIEHRTKHLIERLQQQLDGFLREDGGKTLFLGRFAMMGRVHRRQGGQAVVQFVEDHSDRGRFAVKFFLDRTSFLTEAALYAAAFPHIRSRLSLDAEIGTEMPKWTAEPQALDSVSAGELNSLAVARFLPRVEAVSEGEIDPRGRPLPPCIVMEKGESLLEWSARAEPDLFMSLAVLSNISQRLADMHDAGYVHRDLKPANVMWLPRENRWTVIDFGCVAVDGKEAPLQFTVAYAAPEVIRCYCLKQFVIQAAPTLDAWSLGVMAFELLTGAPAFDLVADGKARVMQRLRGDLPLPWEGELSPKAENKLGALKEPVLGLLQRDPARRGTMRAFHTTCTKIFAARTTVEV